MVTNAAKNVRGEILDTWTQGSPIGNGVLTYLDVVNAPGDSVDIPEMGAFTVNQSEANGPATTTDSATTLIVDQDRFINQAITSRQNKLLLNGNNNYTVQTGRRASGDMSNNVDRFYIEAMLRIAALDPENHFNLDLSATLGDDIVGEMLAALTEQDGITPNSDINWLSSPWAHAKAQTFANFLAINSPQTEANSAFGLPRIATLNGKPFMEHGGVPGRANSTRLQAPITASSVASNVLTATVGAAQADKFVVGQTVFTTGLTANIALATPAQITGISGGNITAALATGDTGDNGTGTLFGASALLMLIYRDWNWFADTGTPEPTVTKRTDAAGYSLQLIHHMGFAGKAGGVKVLHVPTT